ncbi:MAG: DUF1232 domain-containing protein [Bacteroides sp.]|nr:DUF1232 domain-containing protein [Bacteroides sp.]
MKKAKNYVSNPQKMKMLIAQLGNCFSRKGLQNIKKTLVLIRDYLRDVTTGRYKEYHTGKLILIVAAVIYVVSPLDFLPDLLPGGLIDDVSIAVWVMKEVGEELEKYKNKKKEESSC